LALEFIATRLNAEQRVSSEQLVALRAAQLLLEKQCASVGFTESADREDAHDLILRLRAFALPVCDDEPVQQAEKCNVPVRSTEVSELLCNGAPNRYIESEGRCACGALFQAGEPDCRDLMCSGNGASLRDYTTKQPACVCLPGWTGAACQRCADAPDGARWLCIGVPQSLVVAQHTHMLQLVAASTVRTRIDGSYYASGIDKQADSLPGVAPLDCACRTRVNRVDATAFETHIEAFEAAVDEWNEQLTLWAHAQMLLQPRPPTAAAASMSEKRGAIGVASVRQSSGTSALSMACGLLPFAVALRGLLSP
jgi:hypothetical protein